MSNLDQPQPTKKNTKSMMENVLISLFKRTFCCTTEGKIYQRERYSSSYSTKFLHVISTLHVRTIEKPMEFKTFEIYFPDLLNLCSDQGFFR